MMKRITPEQINYLQEGEVFVFGSNLAGRHGKGAALYARKNFGAIYGQYEGLQGQSYAIPTKDCRRKKNVDPYCRVSLHLHLIDFFVRRFIAFAAKHPEYKFLVIAIGCANAGYTSEQIAPMFRLAAELDNVYFTESFWKVLNETK